MDYKSISENAMKGTTTIGIVCSDGVVMGVDSRATMDTFIASTEAIKIHKINDGLAMTIAGGVGDAEYLVKLSKSQNEMYSMNEGKPLSPRSLTSILSLVLQENKMMPFMVGLIVGGMTGTAPEVYNIDAFGGEIKESKFTATGSGSLTALGYLEDVYKESITTQEAVRHAVKALTVAIRRDSATGNTIRVVVMTKGGYKEYSGGELDKFMK